MRPAGRPLHYSCGALHSCVPAGRPGTPAYVERRLLSAYTPPQRGMAPWCPSAPCSLVRPKAAASRLPPEGLTRPSLDPVRHRALLCDPLSGLPSEPAPNFAPSALAECRHGAC